MYIHQKGLPFRLLNYYKITIFFFYRGGGSYRYKIAMDQLVGDCSLKGQVYYWRRLITARFYLSEISPDTSHYLCVAKPISLILFCWIYMFLSLKTMITGYLITLISPIEESARSKLQMLNWIEGRSRRWDNWRWKVWWRVGTIGRVVWRRTWK